MWYFQISFCYHFPVSVHLIIHLNLLRLLWLPSTQSSGGPSLALVISFPFFYSVLTLPNWLFFLLSLFLCQWSLFQCREVKKRSGLHGFPVVWGSLLNTACEELYTTHKISNKVLAHCSLNPYLGKKITLKNHDLQNVIPTTIITTFTLLYRGF